jgi:hypothetical protein
MAPEPPVPPTGAPQQQEGVGQEQQERKQSDQQVRTGSSDALVLIAASHSCSLIHPPLPASMVNARWCNNMAGEYASCTS